MTPDASRAAIFGALSDDTRWRLLTRLGERAMSASELAEHEPVTRQAIAHHLAVLARAGLVEPVREGRQVRFRVLGWRMTGLARDLEAIGRGWERRLDALSSLAESRASAGAPRHGDADGARAQPPVRSGTA